MVWDVVEVSSLASICCPFMLSVDINETTSVFLITCLFFMTVGYIISHYQSLLFNRDILKIAPRVYLVSVCGPLCFRCLLGSAHRPRALITPSPLKPPGHRNPPHGAVWLAGMSSAVLSQALIANYCLDSLSYSTAGWTGDILLLFLCHFQCWRSFETNLWSFQHWLINFFTFFLVNISFHSEMHRLRT